MKPPCRHCHELPANCARRLCWGCYYTPAVRALYPPALQKVPMDGTDALPESPTTARAGSLDKVAVLEARAAAGVCLFHPLDNRRIFSTPTQERMLSMKAAGLSSYQIAEKLNEEGCMTRSGGSWNHARVCRVLARASRP